MYQTAATTTVEPGPGSARPRRKARAAVAGIAFVAVAAASGYGTARLAISEHPAAGPAATEAVQAALTPTSGIAIPTVRPLVNKVLPSVVSIKAVGPRGTSQGTGIIISANGEVLTNAHVVAGATTVTVSRYGSTSDLASKVVGVSTDDDLALIHITGAAGLPAAQLGNSNDARVGDPVVAIGNALGLQAGTPTVTTGIVSAQGRTITAESGAKITGLIQTDAAINPGNSGGPLFDSAGQVIGINTAVAGSSATGQQAQNIGFAIPIERAQALLATLRNGGPTGTPRAHLGVATVTVTESLRDAYGLTPHAGAVVTAVNAASPAAAAGLSPGDVIVGVDDVAVASSEDLRAAVSHRGPGDRAVLQVVRGESTAKVTVTLSAPTAAPAAG